MKRHNKQRIWAVNRRLRKQAKRDGKRVTGAVRSKRVRSSK